MGEADTELLNALFKAVTGGKPDPYQIALLNSKSTRIIINKSRRVGISTTLGIKAVIYALQRKEVLITAPGLPQSREVIAKYVEPVLRALPSEEVPKLIENTKTLKRFYSGGEIVALPNNASTTRGRTPALIIADEFSQFLDGTDETMYEALEPMLVTGEQMILVATPFGDKNKFARIWRGEGGPTWQRTLINYRECPRLLPKIQEIRTGYDDISWSQEFENEFRGEVDSEFPMSLLEKCIDQEMQYEVNAKADMGGADVGRRRDLSCIAKVRMDGDVHRLVEKNSWVGVPFEEQQNRFLAAAKDVGIFRIDQGGMGEAPSEWLQARASNVHPILFTNITKTEMFLSLKRLMEQGKFKMPFDSRLMMSLNSVRRYYNQGRVVIDAERTDETGHADEATALALACWESEQVISQETLNELGRIW